MSDPVSVPVVPSTITPEDAPHVAALIDGLLDDANPSFRKDFLCEFYLVYRQEGTDRAGIFQLSPQQRLPDPSDGGTDDMIDSGGVGSGGWRPEDVSDPGNGPENQ